MQELLHCQAPVKHGRSTAGVYWYLCERCGKYGKGKTVIAAKKEFEKSDPDPSKVKRNHPQMTSLISVPRNPGQVQAWVNQNMRALIDLVSPVITEKPAMMKMLKKNARYLQTAKHLERAWSTEIGQQSIIEAAEDALSLGATLGEMGDIVPFGDTVEFVPAVEAYEFALTNGANAPFRWLKIEAIHENDIVKVGRKGGNFFVDFENMGRPRGDVVQVVVYGENRNGQILGEAYDAERLLKKAEVHSQGYKYYLQDLRSFDIMRAEGKLKKENGREYFVKTMYKKGGASYEKKVFLDELSNPYDGADQPEMLRKAAGKSFLRKYARVRNAEAAMAEMTGGESEEDLNGLIDKAFMTSNTIMPGTYDEDDVTYEVVADDEPLPAVEPLEEKESEQEDPEDKNDQPELEIHD